MSNIFLAARVNKNCFLLGERKMLSDWLLFQKLALDLADLNNYRSASDFPYMGKSQVGYGGRFSDENETDF